MAKSARTQEARSRETVAAVLDIAEKHFAELGYAGVSTEAMVDEAGLTRGALYHHFGSKQGLFEAVVERLQVRLAEAIAEQSEAGVDEPWRGFLAGCFVWLERATEPAIRRILLIDAPAVLGWERWLALDEAGGSSLLKEGITNLTDAGFLKVGSEVALFHLLNGAMNQAALYVAQSPEPEQALKEVKRTLEQMLNGLRA